MGQPRDQLNRPLRDLRISVTDRCNFRCPYCMPKEVFGPDHAFLRDPQLMRLEEMTRIARAFATLGVGKVRLTGGEPLLRGDLETFIAVLKTELRVPEVAMTTNAWLLEGRAAGLAAAGLDRLNVSLDALDDAVAGRMNGRGFGAGRVLRGIEAARAAGLPVKINTVVRRGVNEGEVTALARYGREHGMTVRFIEFMDVGATNHWVSGEVVPAAEIVARLSAEWPMEPLEPAYRGEVAARYRYRDGAGEVGVISSVTEPFCRDCHRARLSADGRLYTCLFSGAGTDVLGRLRAGAGDDELQAFLAAVWSARRDRYSEERAGLLARGENRTKIEMSYIGG